MNNENIALEKLQDQLNESVYKQRWS